MLPYIRSTRPSSVCLICSAMASTLMRALLQGGQLLSKDRSLHILSPFAMMDSQQEGLRGGTPSHQVLKSSASGREVRFCHAPHTPHALLVHSHVLCTLVPHASLYAPCTLMHPMRTHAEPQPGASLPPQHCSPQCAPWEQSGQQLCAEQVCAEGSQRHTLSCSGLGAARMAALEGIMATHPLKRACFGGRTQLQSVASLAATAHGQPSKENFPKEIPCKSKISHLQSSKY